MTGTGDEEQTGGVVSGARALSADTLLCVWFTNHGC